jgi:selenocysteine lyase/cysteine desulfurase
VAPADVAVGATVSGLLGLVAASLPEGARIVAPEGDFTSLLWPFAVRGGLRTVPLADLADAAADADVVAFSAVQSASGAVADLDALAATDALTIVDATQAAGWLPIDASRFDVVAAGAYKWLLSPRGTAFMAVRRERLGDIAPWSASWFGGEDVHGSYYGLPLRLAADARRLDTSPAWFSWVGCAPALELVEEVGVEAIHAHDVGLANRFRAGLGLAPSDSAIVSADVPDARERLEAAGIVAAARAGRMRASWHLYNTEADVDRVLDVLTARRG